VKAPPSFFKTEDQNIAVDVRMEDETVWLTQEQMGKLIALLCQRLWHN